MAPGEVDGVGGGGNRKFWQRGESHAPGLSRFFFHDLDMGVWWWIFGMYIEMYVEVC